MERIGVRELRQYASRYLARVATGETFEVTDRGHPVARLVPVMTDPWDELVASGRVSTVEDGDDVLGEPARDYGVAASAALAAMREHER